MLVTTDVAGATLADRLDGNEIATIDYGRFTVGHHAILMALTLHQHRVAACEARGIRPAAVTP